MDQDEKSETTYSALLDENSMYYRAKNNLDKIKDERIKSLFDDDSPLL